MTHVMQRSGKCETIDSKGALEDLSMAKLIGLK